MSARLLFSWFQQSSGSWSMFHQQCVCRNYIIPVLTMWHYCYSSFTGWRPSASDWGSGMSVVLCRGSTCLLSQALDGWIPHRGLAHTNQLPFPRLWNAAVHESSHVGLSSAVSSIQTFTFYLYMWFCVAVHFSLLEGWSVHLYDVAEWFL